ncbi:MAG: hypothetical protein SNJ71_04575 [Bacteroidales bacterium]
MKKVLLAISAAFLAFGLFAQSLPPGVEVKDVVDWDSVGAGKITWADTVAELWSTKNFDPKKTKTVIGLTGFIPKSASDTVLKMWNPNSNPDAAGQYVFSYQKDGNDDVLKVVFTNKYPHGENNWADFTIQWTYWKEVEGKSPFDYNGDTLCGLLLDISATKAMYMTLKSDKKVRVRVDLVDANGRLSNFRSPVNDVPAGTTYSDYQFDWANPDPTAEGKNSVGSWADAWGGDFWGIDNGRYNAEKAPLYGRQNVKGLCWLDLTKIAKLSVMLDPGTTGTKDEVKTVMIKDITMGSKPKAVSILTDPEKLVSTPEVVAKAAPKVYPVPATSVINTNGTNVVVKTMAGVVVATGVGSVNVAGLAAGLYVVEVDGVATLVQKK